MNLDQLYILLSGLLFACAWYSHVRGNERLAIVLLVFGGLGLRFFVASDFFLHSWDERYHALVAKNMMDAPFRPMLYAEPIMGCNYKDWTHSHVWLHKQPLPLWSMAMSMKTFGVNEIALRLPSIVLSTFGIWLTHDLGKRMYSISVGFFSAFLFAIHGLILEIGSGRVATDHVDLFFLVFILLAVWSAKVYSTNKTIYWNLLCGFAIGLAILTKWLPALVVLPVWLLFQIKEEGWNVKTIFIRFLPLLFVIILVSVPWQLYIQHMFPLEYAWESSFNMKHITQTLENRGGEFYYHFDKMRMTYGEIVYIPFIWFVFITLKSKKIDNWALLVWLIIPYIFFSIAKTKMQGYTLFTAPSLLLICAVFWLHLKKLYSEGKYRWGIVLLMAGLVALPIRFSIERIKPLSNNKSPQWVTNIKQFNEQIDHNKKNLIFNVSRPIDVMFYSNVSAFEDIPTHYILDSLSNEGYEIYINSEIGFRSTKFKTLELNLPE
jgi:4-amino-4-deoxy-L-arabinose transferase